MASSSPETPYRLFDLHCDTLDRIALDGNGAYPGFAEQNAHIPQQRRSSLASNDLHVSLERMAGVPWCQCFAVFVPDPVRGSDAWGLFREVQSFFLSQIERHGSLIRQVFDARDIDAAIREGACAAMLTVEGAAVLDGTLDHIDGLDEAGVKMVTLTWNGPNALGSGNETADGLTRFGRDAVRALEERRIVVDVSHINDRGFGDVLKVAKRPCAASHSNARAICPHPRNLTDAQFRAIAERGGVVGLNFCNSFLTDRHADPTADDVLRHVDHWLELGGEDAVSLGSDYDGCDVPSWLDGIDKTAALHRLLAREFGEGMADKACFGNAYDFFIRNETA